MSEQVLAIWMAAIGAAVTVAVLVCLIYFVYKAKLLEREERRLMIERGIKPPPPPPVGWPGVKMREMELKAEERRLLIEKGMQPGAENTLNMLTQLLAKPEPPKPEQYLQRGLVKLAFGLGLAGAYGVFKSSGIDASSETQNWFLFFGVISPAVTLWGVANVVYYQATRNKRREGEVSGRDPAR